MRMLAFWWWGMLGGALGAITAPADLEVLGTTTFHQGVSGPEANFQSLVANISAGSSIGPGAGDGFHVSAVSGNDTTGDGSFAFPYRTLDMAIAVVAALPPGPTRPTALTVHSGIYTIDNDAGPLALPSYLVIAAAHRYAAILSFSNNSNHGFVMGSDCILQNFLLLGPTQAAVFYDPGTANRYGLNVMSFSRGKWLLEAVGGTGEERFIHEVSMSTSAQGLAYVRNGAILRLGHIESQCTGTLLRADGNGTLIYADNIQLDDAGATATAIHATGGATVEFSNVNMEKGAVGLIVDDAGTFARGKLFTLHEGVASHLQQLHAEAKIDIDGGTMHQDRIAFAAGGLSNIHMHYIDTKEGDQGSQRIGKSSMGIPEYGYATVMGEGKSYTRGMRVYHYESGGATWTDKSSTLALANGGAVDVFPSTAADSAIYFASTLQKDGANVRISGIKLAIATAWVPGTGSIVWEYYDGAWRTLPIMATRDDGTYLPLATDAFGNLVDVEIRLNDVAIANMTTQDPMGLGTAYRWIRARIATPLTGTMPQISQVKLYANAAEINSDGFLTFYGTARPHRTLPISYLGWSSALAGQTETQPFYLGVKASPDTYGIRHDENSYNANNDMSGFTFVAPLEIDTSCPLRITIYYFVTANTAETGTMSIHAALSKNGDTVADPSNAPPTPANMRVVTVPLSWPTNDNEIQKSFTVEMDITDMLAVRETGVKDILWMWIRRDSMSAGNFVVIDLSVEYVSWSLGGHA